MLLYTHTSVILHSNIIFKKLRYTLILLYSNIKIYSFTMCAFECFKIPDLRLYKMSHSESNIDMNAPFSYIYNIYVFMYTQALSKSR